MAKARGTAAFVSTTLGVLAAAALVASAFTVQMYSGSGGTLVDVNGYGVLIPVAIPLVLALITWFGLHAQCKRGSEAGEKTAIIAASIVGGFAILAGFSIGILVLPIAACLGAGVALTPSR